MTVTEEFRYRGVPWWAVALFAAAACAVVAAADVQLLLLLPLGLCAILLMRSPELALLATVAAIPFDPGELAMPVAAGLSVSKSLGALLAAALAYDVVVRGRRVRLLDDPLDYAVILFGGLVLLSCVTGPSADLSSALRVLRMVAFYFCVKNLLRSTEMVERVMWTLVLSGGATAIYGISSFFAARTYRVHDIRIGGAFMHPTDYAALMAVVVVIAFHLFFYYRRAYRARRVVLLTISIVASYAVVLTGSRAGLLALAVALGVAILRQPARWRILPVVILLSILSWSVWPESVTDRVVATVESGSGSREAQVARRSLRRRSTYIPVALDLLAERPLRGHGYHSFSRLYALSDYVRRSNPLNDEDRDRVAHNTYLEIAVGAGLPGLAAYLAVLLLAWANLRRIRRQRAETTAYFAGAFEVGLLSLALSMLFLSIDSFKLTWFVLGLVSALRVAQERPRGATPPREVCMITKEYRPHGGGAEVVTENLARGLVQAGIPVTIVTTRDTVAELGVEEDAGIRIVRILVPPGKAPSALAFIGDGMRVLWARRRRIGVLHTHQMYSATTLGVLGRLALGCPLVVNPHRGGFEGDVVRLRRKGIAGRWRLQVVRRAAAAFVAISDEIAAELRETGIDAGRIARLPYPVDTERFRPPTDREKAAIRSELALPADVGVVAYVGRLDPIKGLPTLFDAMSGVPGHLLVVGDGELRQLLERTAERALRGRVSFAGWQSEVRPWLMASDVVALPSFGEGLPVSLLEAMACGLPVVATPVGGVEEVVRDGETGWLVPCGDGAALADALRRALSDAEVRTRFGARGRAVVESGFAVSRVVERYVALYERIGLTHARHARRR